MRTLIHAAAALSLAALLAPSADAQNANAPAASGPPVLAKTLLPARFGTKLQVTSSAFTSGEGLDELYTQNGANMSPPLQWSKGPPGTLSYVVLAEDSGVNRAEPIVHWIIYNISPGAHGLPQEIPTNASLDNGAEQGKNIAGKVGYIGPKPPAGQTHPYHFQVFALNTTLHIDPDKADRATIVNAMKSRVLASGDVVANYTGK
jgi:Raf kinase inhibitor-like YbhB/YbcL family protein